MKLLLQSRLQSRPPSFFSTKLSPKKNLQFQGFQTEIDNDSVYFMAQEVKHKISGTSRKSMKKQPKTPLILIQKQNDSTETNFQSCPSHQNKTTCTSKSLNPNKQRVLNISNTLQNQRRLLSKITIHRIRSQRQQLQNQTKRISNSYNYLLQQIEKDKKKSIKIKIKQQKVKQIHEQSKKMKSQLHHGKAIFLQEKLLEKSRLREAVLKQKKNKEKSLSMFYDNLQKKASQIRLESQKIDQQILKAQLTEIEKKKLNYLSEKEKEKRRLLTREKNLQDQKVYAQTQFKQKWLRQFNQTSKARKAYITKKEILSQKMERLFFELQHQQNQFFESIQKQKFDAKVQSGADPEQFSLD